MVVKKKIIIIIIERGRFACQAYIDVCGRKFCTKIHAYSTLIASIFHTSNIFLKP